MKTSKRTWVFHSLKDLAKHYTIFLNENKLENLGISLFEGLGQVLLHRGVGSPELVQLVRGDQPDEDDHDNDDGVDDDDDDQPGAVVEEQLDGDEGKWEGDDQGGE